MARDFIRIDSYLDLFKKTDSNEKQQQSGKFREQEKYLESGNQLFNLSADQKSLKPVIYKDIYIDKEYFDRFLVHNSKTRIDFDHLIEERLGNREKKK